MTKIKYVGVKLDGETAFTAAAKMADPWMPGDVREIDDEKLVAQMLQHPDVFARDDANPAKAAQAPAPAPTAAAPTAAALKAPLDEDTNTGGSLAPGAEVKAEKPPAPAPAPAAAKVPAKKAAAKKSAKKK